MAKRVSKAAAGHAVPAVLPGQISIDEFFAELEERGAREDVDWSAMDQFRLGELVPAILRSDAGIMLRSSDRGRAVSVGLFVGGRSQWTTCVDQRELLAVLQAAAERLEKVAGAARAPLPTRKARRGS